MKSLRNSAIVALTTTVIALCVASFCAYALARLKIKGKYLILGIVLSISTFPQIAIAAPLFKLWSDIGIFNTYIGLIIPYLTFALPLSIYILVSFFREIPKDLEEAALVDGATHFQAFRKVVVPLAAPGLATAGILTFIGAWNEFLLAVTLTSSVEGAHGAGGDLVLHGRDRARDPLRQHLGGLGGHLGTADHPRAAVPEADRGRSDRGRRQGVSTQPSAVPGLAEVLSPAGWPNASSASVGAGDPGRFNCLFGRDSLITSLAVLPARPDVAAAALRALAALQGTRDDVMWDEEPGKIVHEVRPGISLERQDYLGLEVPDGDLRYYGSADSTPLFLHVLATTGDAALAGELEPVWRAAGDWLLGALSRGGGLLRWERRAPGGPRAAGLARHRGPAAALWRRHPARGRQRARAAGRRRRHPGGRARGAARAGAAVRRRRARGGRRGARGPHRRRVGPRHDGPRRPRPAGARRRIAARVAAVGGGAVDGAAERLCEPDVLTGFGLRTLSDRHPQFEASSYHRGSVWPFDSWLGWGGLRAAGRPRRPSGCARACSPPSSGSGATRSSTRSPRRGRRGDRHRRTSCRPGRWAPSGRCATSGTEAPMWWRDGVLYQIYPRSFADSDGDGVGDLRGIIEHLDHLAWLGIDGLWMNPTFPSPNADWGFDVSDYRGVHPELGTLEDLDELVARARELGIRVLLDLVPNHTSDEHPWFRERRDYYVWREGQNGEPPNNWMSLFGGPAWTRDDETGLWYLHNFDPSSPTSTGGTTTSAPSSTTSCASGSTAGSRAFASTSPTASSRTASCATTRRPRRTTPSTSSASGSGRSSR